MVATLETPPPAKRPRVRSLQTGPPRDVRQEDFVGAASIKQEPVVSVVALGCVFHGITVRSKNPGGIVPCFAGRFRGKVGGYGRLWQTGD